MSESPSEGRAPTAAVPAKIRRLINSATTPTAVASTERPSTDQTGLTVFDTTLGKPIWWNGTAWVDATGTAV